MFKKIMVIGFAVLSFASKNANAVVTEKEFLDKCSFLAKAQNVTSDAEIGKYVKQENQCLKQKIIKLININIKDVKYRNQIRKDFETAEKSFHDLFYVSKNFNKSCQTSPTSYDCGTASRNYFADAKVQELLKIYLKFMVEINEDGLYAQ